MSQIPDEVPTSIATCPICNIQIETVIQAGRGREHNEETGELVLAAMRDHIAQRHPTALPIFDDAMGDPQAAARKQVTCPHCDVVVHPAFVIVHAAVTTDAAMSLSSVQAAVARSMAAHFVATHDPELLNEPRPGGDADD